MPASKDRARNEPSSTIANRPQWIHPHRIASGCCCDRPCNLRTFGITVDERLEQEIEALLPVRERRQKSAEWRLKEALRSIDIDDFRMPYIWCYQPESK